MDSTWRSFWSNRRLCGDPCAYLPCSMHVPESGFECSGSSRQRFGNNFVGRVRTEGSTPGLPLVRQKLRQAAGTGFGNMRARRDAQKCFPFRQEPIWVDSACSTTGQRVHVKSRVRLGCSPRYTQIVPKWPLAGHLARGDFLNTRVRRDTQMLCRFRRERLGVDSALLRNGGKRAFEIMGQAGVSPAMYPNGAKMVGLGSPSGVAPPRGSHWGSPDLQSRRAAYDHRHRGLRPLSYGSAAEVGSTRTWHWTESGYETAVGGDSGRAGDMSPRSAMRELMGKRGTERGGGSVRILGRHHAPKFACQEVCLC